MTLLNQIIALNKGQRAKAEKALTESYHALQKPDMLAGITKIYQPRDDEGEQLAGEIKRPITNVEKLLAFALPDLKRSYDLALTMDVANTTAKADLTVDGTVLLADVPVTFLMPLEKRLVDLRTVIAKIPTLDPSEKWTWDDNMAAYASEPTVTNRSKKVPKNHVLAKATDKHAEQVQVYHEDVVVGDWTTTKFSGSIPLTEKLGLLDRVDKLIGAVQSAREAANSVEVTDVKAGEAILDWLFDGVA